MCQIHASLYESGFVLVCSVLPWLVGWSTIIYKQYTYTHTFVLQSEWYKVKVYHVKVYYTCRWKNLPNLHCYSILYIPVFSTLEFVIYVCIHVCPYLMYVYTYMY